MHASIGAGPLDGFLSFRQPRNQCRKVFCQLLKPLVPRPGFQDALSDFILKVKRRGQLEGQSLKRRFRAEFLRIVLTHQFARLGVEIQRLANQVFGRLLCVD